MFRAKTSTEACAAPYRESLSPESQKDYDIILNGRSTPQPIVFTEIPYVDHNNNKKTIVSAVYNVVYDTLPSKLPTLLPPPSPCPAYELRDVPGKGKGLIAIRDIYPGELVLVERPILISPVLLIDVNFKFSSFHVYTERKMNQEDWIKFNDLSNFMQQDTNTSTSIIPQLKFEGIRNTNGFGINLQEGKERYSGVFLEQARLNHSCGPNLRNIWDSCLFTMSTQAVRPIRAGEELTIEYINPFLPYAERQSILKNTFKFKYECQYCTETTPTSDQNRQKVMPNITFVDFNSIYNRLIVSQNNTLPRNFVRQEVKLLVKKLKETLATITKEGVEATAAPIVYVCLMKLSGVLGDKKEFKKWGFKTIQSPMDYIEFNDGEKMYRKVEQWIDWVKSPKKFPGWGRYK